MNKTLADRLYGVRTGPQFHAMIAAMLGREPQTTAAYVGKASVTSDGFVMCNFRDPDGDYHMGAFVCAFSDLQHNIDKLCDYLDLTMAEAAEVEQLLQDWIAVDYRPHAVRRVN